MLKMENPFETILSKEEEARKNKKGLWVDPNSI